VGIPIGSARDLRVRRRNCSLTVLRSPYALAWRNERRSDGMNEKSFIRSVLLLIVALVVSMATCDHLAQIRRAADPETESTAPVFFPNG
jgi:hypothetical protein